MDHQVTITITVRTGIDTTLSYPSHMSEAGKAVQTVKNKIVDMFGQATFENSYVAPVDETNIDGVSLAEDLVDEEIISRINPTLINHNMPIDDEELKAFQQSLPKPTKLL